jgi:hypothetical protein
MTAGRVLQGSPVPKTAYSALLQALGTRKVSGMYSVGAYRGSIVRQLSGRVPCRHQCHLIFLTRGHLHNYRPAGQLTPFSSKVEKEHSFAGAVAPVAAGAASSTEGDLGDQQCRCCMQGHPNNEISNSTNLEGFHCRAVGPSTICSAEG